ARAAAERESTRLRRPVDRALRRRRRGRADAAGRRVLPLGEAVDLVVEQHDLHVHVTAQHVHQVVAADRQAIAVAGDQPDVEFRIGELDTGRERRRAAVDRVEAVAFDVVGEAARAADTADEHGLRRIGADLRKRALHRLEDRVVAATRAPANLLVGFPILERSLDGGHVVHGFTLALCGERCSGRSEPSSWPDAGSGSWATLAGTSPPSFSGMPSKNLSIASSSSAIAKGWPLVLVRLSASTSNWSRSTVLNCPVFISGTSTLSKPASNSPRFFGSGQTWRTWIWLTARPR